MPGELSRAAAIIGAAEADWIGYPETPKTAMQLHISAIKNVSTQTGIPISAIDGIFSAGFSSAIAEHLGLSRKTIGKRLDRIRAEVIELRKDAAS